jgi:conjugative transposon TraM protein
MAITNSTKQTEVAAKKKRTGELAAFAPIIVAPALAGFFWIFGGGAGTPANATAATTTGGLNTELPQAVKGTIPDSKLQTKTNREDSLRNRDLFGGLVTADTSKAKPAMGFGANEPGSAAAATDQTVALAAKQLEETKRLQMQASSPPVSSSGSSASSSPARSSSSSLTPQEQQAFAVDKKRREEDLQRTQENIARVNRDMLAANAAASVASRPAAVVPAVEPKKKVAKTKAQTVNEADGVVSHFGTDAAPQQQATFQGFNSESGAENDVNTLSAVIHDSQEVTNGSLVKMRLTDAAVVDGHRLPANSFIYGKCSLSGERLTISIQTLKSGNNIFPAALEVYDMDGLQGLHIPRALSRDQAKQAGAQGISGADMMTMSSNPATMAAGVAVGAIKNIGTAKIRQVKVKLKAGYNLMLKVDKE